MAMWLLTITIATKSALTGGHRWCIHWASTPIDSHCPGREYFQVSFVSRTSWVILTNCQRLWTDLPGQEHKGDLAQNYSLYYHFNLCLPLNGPEQRVALEVLIWQASSSTITWSTVCYKKVGPSFDVMWSAATTNMPPQGTRRKIWLLAEPWNAVSTYSFSFEVSTRILYRSVAARRCSKHIYGCFCISLQGGLHLLRRPLLQDVWWPSKALDYVQWAKSYGEVRILQWQIPTQSLFQAVWEMRFWEFINWALHCST